MLYELLFGMNPYNMAGCDLTSEEFKEAIQENELMFPDSELYDIEYSDNARDFI